MVKLFAGRVLDEAMKCVLHVLDKAAMIVPIVMAVGKISVIGVGAKGKMNVCFVMVLEWIHGVILVHNVGDEVLSLVSIVQGEVMLIALNVEVEVMRIAIIVMVEVIPIAVYVLALDNWCVHYVMARELLQRIVKNVKEKERNIRFVMSVMGRDISENHFDIL
jgi:hypothetical protein